MPVNLQGAVAMVTRSAFTAGLNQILLVAAVIAFVSGLVSLVAIRGQDFAAQSALAGDLPEAGLSPTHTGHARTGTHR